MSHNGDEPQEKHLADWLATQRSRRGTISHKTVKKRCRDNQSRGRPRMNPSALAPARDPQDLVHSNHGGVSPLPGERNINSTEPRSSQARPLGLASHVPSWLGPTNLVYVCVSRLYETHPWRAASFGLPNVVCRSFLCLDPRTVTGETFCLVLRPAHPASCIVPHDVKWSTTAVSSSSDRVPDHLTVGRNLHMKDAGTITSPPGGASGFRILDGEIDTWCRTVVTVLLSNPSCELGPWERRPRTTA